MPSEYDLQREAEILQEEIRDINAKSISIAKIFSGVVLAFFAYVFFGLAAFAALSPAADDSLISKLFPSLSRLLGYPSQSGIPKQMAFAAKIYSLTGILFTFTLLGIWLYMSGQWATSKRHRIRYWRQIHHIRNFLLGQNNVGRDFRNLHCILPLSDDRPQISPRNRHFVGVSMVATCFFLVFAIVYFTFGWHIKHIWHLHTEFDVVATKIESVTKVGPGSGRSSGEVRQRESSVQSPGADVCPESPSPRKNAEKEHDDQLRLIVEAFPQIMAPSSAFLLIGFIAAICFSVGNHQRLFLAEAVSHRDPYPRLPRMRRHIVKACKSSTLILAVVSCFAVLIFGAHAIPHDPALMGRGITLDYICGLDVISGRPSEEAISIWWAYGVFLVSLALCGICQVIRFGCIAIERYERLFRWLPLPRRLRCVPGSGERRLASIRRIVGNGTRDYVDEANQTLLRVLSLLRNGGEKHDIEWGQARLAEINSQRAGQARQN